MAGFEIRESLKVYFDEKPLRAAVDALSEVLQGDVPPTMTWDEARNYNQALLMAAQVRADYNEMLFALWECTFGRAVEGAGEKFKVEFEPDFCTPDNVWNEGTVWQTMSRDGLQQPKLIQAFEIYADLVNGLVYLAVAKWDGKEGKHTDFDFDPAAIGDGTRWQSLEDDEKDVIARTQPIPVKDFLSNPDGHIPDMRVAAEEVVSYLSKII